MTEEDLAKMDFSKDWKSIGEATTILKNKNIRHWIIAELTDESDTFSKYHFAQWHNLPDSQEVGRVTEGVNSEVMNNHLGGLVAVVFDIFAGQFEANFNRRPNFGELIDIMSHFHKIYLNNVQPK